MTDRVNRFFLFLGEADSEGVLSKLKTNDIEYRKKMLESGLDNWKIILRLLRHSDLSGVVASLPAHSMSRAVSDTYLPLTREMFSLIKDKPHLVFIHETFFRGPISGKYDEYYSFGFLTEEEETKIRSLFDEFQLTLAPYKTNAEKSVLATEFVDNHGSNLAFRMYIPHDRIWSSETGSIISLFRDYLTRVSGINIRQEQYSTPLGTVYEMFASDGDGGIVLQDEFRDFSDLLDTVSVDPEAARTVLTKKNIDSKEVIAIVDRYAKEAKRINIDLKHDRERKVLSIRHRMEAELIDHIDDPAGWDAVNSLVDAAIPSVAGVSTAVGLLPSPSSHSPNVTLNLNPQIIQTVNGVVAQEIHGNQSFGTEVQEVLRLIQEYGNEEALQLASAVYEIEDPEIRQGKKLTALQRLKSFVYQAGAKMPDVAFGVLQTYIEAKMGLS